VPHTDKRKRKKERKKADARQTRHQGKELNLTLLLRQTAWLATGKLANGGQRTDNTTTERQSPLPNQEGSPSSVQQHCFKRRLSLVKRKSVVEKQQD
jgi:hypothetical protein